jgi:disulfide bond formation protein DsbB
MAMLGVFFFALLALAWRKLSGLALGVSTLFAAGGVAATGMHFWVLWGPGSRSCGAGLKIWVANFVDALPGSGWLFKATGDCALATDRLLGLPLPVWSCGVFLVLLAILLAPALKRVFAQSGPGTER